MAAQRQRLSKPPVARSFGPGHAVAGIGSRAVTLNRKADARRKIILGGLLLDAAMKDPAWESRLNDLMSRISRDQDRKAFEGWTFKGGPADA
jgi:hypothetical protein